MCLTAHPYSWNFNTFTADQQQIKQGTGKVMEWSNKRNMGLPIILGILGRVAVGCSEEEQKAEEGRALGRLKEEEVPVCARQDGCWQDTGQVQLSAGAGFGCKEPGKKEKMKAGAQAPHTFIFLLFSYRQPLDWMMSLPLHLPSWFWHILSFQSIFQLTLYDNCILSLRNTCSDDKKKWKCEALVRGYI